MKTLLILAGSLCATTYAGAQEIAPVKTTFEDMEVVLNQAGFESYAYDLSSFLEGDTRYDVAIRIKEYDGGKELDNDRVFHLGPTRMLLNDFPEEYRAEIPDSVISETGVIEIALRDMKGQVRRLTELKGKVVILDFTIYQSAVSASHNYMLRELYDKYASQGLEIYQVSLDADEHYWKTTADNLPWICVRDANGVYSSIAAAYNVQNMPSIFLVNRNNELSVRGELIKDLEAEVKKLL